MAVRYQLVINCVGHPEPLARFWAEALGYVLEPPPAGFASWDDWRRGVGLPESWLGRGTDCIIDPDGAGPRIWIQVVPDRKTTSNRLHIDVHASGGPDLPIETRKKRVDAEALRLRDLGATLLSDLSEELEEGAGHYAVALKDPEGNEFDINLRPPASARYVAPTLNNTRQFLLSLKRHDEAGRISGVLDSPVGPAPAVAEASR